MKCNEFWQTNLLNKLIFKEIETHFESKLLDDIVFASLTSFQLYMHIIKLLYVNKQIIKLIYMRAHIWACNPKLWFIFNALLYFYSDYYITIT